MLGAMSLRDGDFVAVDIETTGPVPGCDSIIEIGAVRIRAGRPVGYFETLVRPERPIPRSIVDLTGISDDMVANAPAVREAVCAFRAFADGAVLVAHNHRFDMGFLDFESERIGCQPFHRPVLDTLLLSRRLHPDEPRHNLRDVSRRYGIAAVPTHRALADASATAEVFRFMLKELLAIGVEDAAGAARLCGLAPRGELARKLVLATSLPDAPGVFVLRDGDGGVLYVGRARRIRSRVRSMFYRSPDDRESEAVAQTQRVDAMRCASGLHALLLESRLRARYAPPYTQDNERGRTMAYVRVDTKQPYPPVTVMRRRPRTGMAIGPFTNVWALQRLVESLKEHYGLRRCSRRLNGVVPPTSCAYRTASACPRPCAGAVDLAEYGSRLTAALSVFEGSHPRFKAVLQALWERAAMDMRCEDAIVHRDTLKALDKSISSLEIVRAAVSSRGSAIVEIVGDEATVVLVRHGRVASIVRGSIGSESLAALRSRLIHAARRAYSPERMAEDVWSLSNRQLRELFIVDGYRRHVRPVEVLLASGPDELVDSVMAVFGTITEAPSDTRSEALSGA